MPKPTLKIKKHGHTQIEVVFEHPLIQNEGKKKILTDLFILLPPNLGLHPNNYRPDQFFRDLTTHILYGIPNISLIQILDQNCTISPLYRIQHMKNNWLANQPQEMVLYELRMLGSLFWRHIDQWKKKSRGLFDLSSAQKASPPLSDQNGIAKPEVEVGYTALESARTLILNFRALKRGFFSLHPPHPIQMAFEHTDELLSLLFEELVCRVLWEWDRAQIKAGLNPPEPSPIEVKGLNRTLLLEWIGQEREHRLTACYPSLLDASSGPLSKRANETYLFRRDRLKRYAHAILFLAARSFAGTPPLLFSLHALTAMAAMTIYLLFVLWVIPSDQFNTLSAVFWLALAYAFKDRIKEGLKHFFYHRLTGVLRDRFLRLEDPFFERRKVGGRGIGWLAEGFSFLKPSQVPEEVGEAGVGQEWEELLKEGSVFYVMRYQRRLSFSVPAIFRAHRRVDRLREVWRFHIGNLLAPMDVLSKRIPVFHPKPHPSIRAIQVPKTYLVAWVLQIQYQEAGEWKKEVVPVNIVLTRRGIQRIEKVGRRGQTMPNS